MTRPALPKSKYAMYTAAPWALALGFAMAAHLGWFCPGHADHSARIDVHAESGINVSVSDGAVNVRRAAAQAKKDLPWIPTSAKGVFRSAETINVPRELGAMLMAEPTMLTQYGTALPLERDGKFYAWKLKKLKRGGLLRKFGFRNNDLITAVEGHDVRCAGRLEAMFVEGLRDGKITISVERRGDRLQKHFVLD